MRTLGIASLALVGGIAACAQAQSEPPVPVVDQVNRTVEYPLECEGGAEPTLSKEDVRTAILTCPGPNGRRLKVVCTNAPVITKKPNGHYHFECT